MPASRILPSRTATARFDWTPAGRTDEFEALLWWNGVENAQIRPARTSYDGFAVDYALDTFGGSLTERLEVATPLGALDLAFGAEAFAARFAFAMMITRIGLCEEMKRKRDQTRPPRRWLHVWLAGSKVAEICARRFRHL